MTESLQKALDIIIRVADPDRIILFGSHARNEANDDSDYDLLVLKKNIIKKRRLAQKIYSNFKNIGAPIDIIVNDLSEYEILKNDPYMIYETISKEGLVIYDKN